jgi:DNA-binding transcriptional regulator YiaG
MKKKTKTIFDPRYKFLIEELVRIRHKKNLSQADLAKLWGASKTHVGRTEIRDRRLDIIETIDLLKAMKLSRAEILKVIAKLI